MSRTIVEEPVSLLSLKLLAAYSPETLVEQAIQKLLSAGIQLIEFRYQLYRRMGVPAGVLYPCYIVKDETKPATSSRD